MLSFAKEKALNRSYIRFIQVAADIDFAIWGGGSVSQSLLYASVISHCSVYYWHTLSACSYRSLAGFPLHVPLILRGKPGNKASCLAVVPEGNIMKS